MSERRVGMLRVQRSAAAWLLTSLMLSGIAMPWSAAAAECPYEDHLVLGASESVMGPTVGVYACQTLTLDSGFVVGPEGNAYLAAGETIHLRPGVRVQAGGRLQVRAGVDVPQPLAPILAVSIPGAGTDNQLSVLSGQAFATGPLEVLLDFDQEAPTLTFALVGDPAWLGVDPGTGSIGGTAPTVTAPQIHAFTVRVTAGDQQVDVSGSVSITPVLESATVTTTGFDDTLSLAGVIVRIPAGSAPAGTGITVTRGETVDGERVFVLSADVPLDTLGDITIELGNLVEPDSAMVPLSEIATRSSGETSKYCDTNAPFQIGEEESRYFIASVYRMPDAWDGVLQATANVLSILAPSGSLAVNKRTASVLCSPVQSPTMHAQKTPVLFIHGYQFGDGIKGFGGGTSTWGSLFYILQNTEWPDGLQILPMEFRWRTNASFSDVAGDLRRAIDELYALTGAPVHIVSHSFGGVLARGYLQGLDYGRPVDHQPRVASLTTVGTPHSGAFSSDRTAWEVAFPQGVDDSLTGIGTRFCQQTSCYETGAGVAAENDIAKVFPWLTGVGSGWVAAELTKETNLFPEKLPVQSLIGLRREVALSEWTRFTGGDGLISFEGQRFSPSFRQNENLLGSQASYGPLGLADMLGARVREVVLGVESDVPDFPGRDVTRDFPGFGHTSLHQLKYKQLTCWFPSMTCLPGSAFAHEAEVNIAKTPHALIDHLIYWLRPVTLSPFLEVTTVSGDVCTQYGMCGLEFTLSEGIDASEVTLLVTWGDSSTLGQMTLQQCLNAGICSSLGDGRYRIWHRYTAGNFSGELHWEATTGLQGVVPFSVTVGEIQELALQAQPGEGSVTLDWPALPADQYNLCRSETSVSHIDNCYVEGGRPIDTDIGMPPHLVSGLTNDQGYFFRLEGKFGSDRIMSNEATATPQEDLSAGPISHWRFDGDAFDSSGNGHHGVMHGPTPAEDRFGRHGRALSFNGISDYVSVPHNTTFNLVGDYSFSVWFYQRSTSGSSGQRLINKVADGSCGGWNLDTYDGVTGRKIRMNVGCPWVNADRVHDLSAWNHVVVSVANGVATIYLNGEPNGGGIVGATPINGLNVLIGRSTGNHHFFDGTIDDLRIYDRALSFEEVLELHQLSVVDTNYLLAHWSFDEGEGLVVRDVWGGKDFVSSTSEIWSEYGVVGSALEIAGRTGVAVTRAPDSDFSVPLGTEISLSAWVSRTERESSQVILSRGRSTLGEPSLVWFFTPNDRLAFAYCPISPNLCNIWNSHVLLPQATDVWEHFALTYTYGLGGSLRAFWNGRALEGEWVVGGGNVTPANENRVLRIGSQLDANDNVNAPLRGRIDELMLWKGRTLTPNEIHMLYMNP